LETWPATLKDALYKTMRTPQPIAAPEDLRAVLKKCPETFLSNFSFSEIFELDGWYFVSIDNVEKPMWINGALVQKGASEMYFFSRW
jgi:hypothetical protein